MPAEPTIGVRRFARVEKSYDVGWALILALHLVLRAGGKSIRLEEFFAGLYLINREALLPYWPDSSALDTFVREGCGLPEPPWYYWIEYYQAAKTRYRYDGAGRPFSKELVVVAERAMNLALRARKASRKKLQIEMAHVLSALAANPPMKFARRMFKSGFRLRETA